MSDAIPEAVAATQDENLVDAALIRAFSKGDAAAMDRLVARYRRPLFSWLLGMVRDRPLAEDLYQDIWLKIIKGAGEFQGSSFRAWMWRIARNHVIDSRRKHRPLLTLDTPVGNDPDDEDSATRLDQLTDDRPIPAERLEADENLRALRQAVLRLPDLYRDIVLLRTRGGLGFQEIADQLGLPLSTVLSRMHDITERLKTQLNDPKKTKKKSQ